MGEKFTAGGALAQSLVLWSRNVVPFLGAGILALFPIVGLASLGRPLPTARAQILVTLVQYVLVCLAVGTITHSVLEQLRGRHPGTLASLSVGAARTWLLFRVLVATALLTAGAGLFLVVPGLVCGVRWALVGPVVVAEGGAAPWARSSRLTEGHGWAIFGLLLFLVAAPLVLATLLLAVVPETRLGVVLAVLLGLALPLGLFVSFGAALLAVSYHLLRSEKEGNPEVAEVFG